MLAPNHDNCSDECIGIMLPSMSCTIFIIFFTVFHCSIELLNILLFYYTFSILLYFYYTILLFYVTNEPWNSPGSTEVSLKINKHVTNIRKSIKNP